MKMDVRFAVDGAVTDPQGHDPGARSPARPTLLLVDDEPTNLHVLRHSLQDEYNLVFARSGEKALARAAEAPPDLVLLDIMMPDLSGFDVCRRLKQIPRCRDVPVIFVTAMSDDVNEEAGLALGAVDYIVKPFNPAIVRARVRTHLSLVQVRALRRTQLQLVRCLGLAAEYKDNETGAHVMRISYYARALGRAAGADEHVAETLLHAAPLHDVGKIGIPDAILRKPGKLTPDEWEIMRQHAEIGARIIGEHNDGVLAMAATIALSHHEKWDGTGYPQGLAGADIPWVSRVVAVVDVFDALTSERPYKRAWTVDEALQWMREQSGRHLDQHLVACFDNCLPEILNIRARWSEAAWQASAGPAETDRR